MTALAKQYAVSRLVDLFEEVEDEEEDEFLRQEAW